jgi:hypothetical protein
MLCLQSDGEKQGELHGQQESRHMLVAHPTPGTLSSLNVKFTAVLRIRDTVLF